MNFGNYFFKVPASIDYQIKIFNHALISLTGRHKNFYLFDINHLIFQFGNPRDSRILVNSDIHFSLDFTKHLALNIYNYLSVFEGNSIKCIILDLDNTIWGGVIGDDGIIQFVN